MRRILHILWPPLLVSIISWGVGFYFLWPNFERWALKKITVESEKTGLVQIVVKDLDVSIFNLSLLLNGIDISLLNEQKAAFERIYIDQTQIRLDFLKLISGQFKISAFLISGVDLKINIDPLLNLKKTTSSFTITDLFRWTDLVPIDRLLLQEVSVEAYSKEQNFYARLNQIELFVNIVGRKINSKVNASKIFLKYLNYENSDFNFKSQFVLTPKDIKIIQMQLDSKALFIQTQGLISELQNSNKNPIVDLNLDMHTELSLWPLKVLSYHLPMMQGQARLSTRLEFKESLSLSDLKIESANTKIGRYTLGHIFSDGQLDHDELRLKQIKLQHPSGEAILQSFKLNLKDKMNFTSEVVIQNLDVQNFLQTLNLKNIPVQLGVDGNASCSGQILEDFFIKCQNTVLQAKKIQVFSEVNRTQNELFALERLKAEGDLELNRHKLSWMAKAQLQKTLGQVDGQIDFEKGFNIKYSTDNFDFSEIANLARLDFKGQASIQGQIEGNAHTAEFELQAIAKDLHFEKYFLGQVDSRIRYKAGHLFLEDIKGTLSQSVYKGDIDINLNDKKMAGQLQSDRMHLTDLKKVFEKIYNFPLSVFGAGPVKLDFSGPMDLFQMNFDLKSQFKSIILAKENFDQLDFNIKSNDGNMQFKDVKLSRSTGRVLVSGLLSNDKNWNLKFFADGWHIEDFNFMSESGSFLYGLLNFKSQLKGPFKSPIFETQGGITQSVLDNQEIADSSFLFKISKDEMFADVDMFGQAIKGQVRWPFVSGLPLDLKVKFINWNFIQFLSAYFGRNFFNEYNSSFSGDVNLQSENGDPWKVTGQAKIINFYMQRGDSFFKNTKTAIISFINGIGKIENFNLEGRQNKIQIQSERFSQEDMALDVLTAVDLRLFHFLLPFLDELGGPFNMSAQFSGPYNKPEILGSAKIANGYLKLKGIPHQFEKIESDIVFSQSKILIGSLKSDFAGGKIKGDGQILIAGIRNLPTAVRLNFQNVQLNIPDKFSSQGYGDLLFSGSWFPFTLSGSYFVQSGLITKEMTSDSATGNIKINSYLAQVLKEKSIDPIVLDLQVLVDKGIAIKNALIDGKVNGAVQVKGAPRTPGILGKINFEKKSKVFFKDSAFEVQTSSIQFNNLSEINPDLYIAAQSRVSDYDVNLLIQGPAQSPNIQLSSLPPLGEQDIISLLALGVTSSKLDQNIQSKQQAEQTGYIIGSAIFSAQNPLNKTLKERLGLNLQFSTGFDSTKNISVPKVTLSRRLSEKVNASASRTLGEQSSYEFKLQYAINSNVSAIGIYESRDANEGSSVQAQNKDTQNILGLDLEFKTEFK